MKDFTVDRYYLSKSIGIENSLLTYVLYIQKIENSYVCFDIPKKSGGVRTINAPHENLKYIQRHLASMLIDVRDKYYKKNNIRQIISHGFEKEKNIITNAKIHKGKKVVINMDIEDFFPSFNFGRVRGYFKKNKMFDFSHETATLIAQISTYNGKLPQGAPTSPVIANLIFHIVDIQIINLARKYKLNYTRYADDLTFSTNELEIIDNYDTFLGEIKDLIERNDFRLNDRKTRMLYPNTRQEVTGLTVNKKVNISRRFSDDTRAMTNSLFKRGFYYIDKPNKIVGSLNQLEGKLSFINQIDWYNNKLYVKNNTPVEGVDKKYKYDLFNKREKYYRDFLFYKYFYNPDKPVIVTEGKTDIMHIKAALMYYHDRFPKLINKMDDKFVLQIHCLRKTKRLKYFFGIVDGANSMNNIYHAYKGSSGFENSFEYIDGKRKRYLISLGKGIVDKTIEDDITSDIGFEYAIAYIISLDNVSNKKKDNNLSDTVLENIGIEYYNRKYSDNGDIVARKPVILLMDNERNSGDQLQSFLNTTDVKLDYENTSINIFENLYLQTLPLPSKIINDLRNRDQKSKKNKTKVKGVEIEDLYDYDFLHDEINGKYFSREDNYDNTKYIGKYEFAAYVKRNYGDINFEKFLPLLESINRIVEK